MICLNQGLSLNTLHWFHSMFGKLEWSAIWFNKHIPVCMKKVLQSSMQDIICNRLKYTEHKIHVLMCMCIIGKPKLHAFSPLKEVNPIFIYEVKIALTLGWNWLNNSKCTPLCLIFSKFKETFFLSENSPRRVHPYN